MIIDYVYLNQTGGAIPSVSGCAVTNASCMACPSSNNADYYAAYGGALYSFK